MGSIPPPSGEVDRRSAATAVGWGVGKQGSYPAPPTRLPPIKSGVADLPLRGKYGRVCLTDIVSFTSDSTPLVRRVYPLLLERVERT